MITPVAFELPRREPADLWRGHDRRSAVDPCGRRPTERVKTTSEYLSPREAAELIGLHVKVIRRAISAGELPASKLRSRLRIRRSDLYGWIENGRVQARTELEDELWP